MKTLATAVALACAVTTPAMAVTFSNSTPIVVVDGGETSSNITSSGLSGNITSLTVTLSGLSHTYPDDLVFGLLNNTTGLGFVFFSGVGGSADVNDITLTFSDFASGQAPESFVGGTLTSGTYLPSNFGQYEFTSFTNATSFADFNGSSGNAAWTLFVDDVFPADGGQILRGWSLDITTDATGAVPEPATWAMMMLGMGLVGAAMRRRNQHAKVNFAF